MSDMDRHVQQSNDRLLCIKQHLSNPGGFQNAARELLEWCSDSRAFQRPFEGSLISCLTVVSQVADKPGYDLDLGYRLLAVCAAHRDKFSSKSANLLSMWCEELGRLLLVRHQKNRTPDAVKGPGMHPQLQKSMPPAPDANGAWPGGNQQPQQSLSVVTTVWNVTATTQSGPFTHSTPTFTNTTMSSTNYAQPSQGIYPGNPLQKEPPYNPHGMPYRGENPNYGGRPSGYPPTPNTPGANHGMTTPSEYPQPPSAALSAAALVAAATATATATATASMVALQEQQNQNMSMNMNMNVNHYQQGQNQQPNYNNQYGMHQQRPQGPMNGPMGQAPPMGQGPGPGPMPPTKGAMYNRRRHTPYPAMHMNKSQTQFPNGTQFMPQGPYPPGQQPYPSKPQYPPSQQPLPSPPYMGPQPSMRPNGPAPPYNGNPAYIAAQNQYPQSRPHPSMNQYPPAQQGFPQQSGMTFPHSPIPGNPTPPITPRSAMSPYVSPGADIKPNFGEFKPQMPIKKENDELRLTFPVRDGVVLPPFRLEHNLAVSNHAFHLRDTVYQTLMWRSDLELQLKCFHHEDRQMSTNWPASVTVSVNANPLNIERGENKTSHKPLYLKDVCQPGRNTIQITVTACCCSHLFVLQLVHRPSVRSVLQGLLKKRLLPAEHCVTKIKRNFTNGGGNTLNGDDGVEQTAIKVSLKCPITFRRITLPARGHDCKHIQCFDLESYLQLNCERGSWRCPVCNKSALLEGLEIDQYIWSVLTKLTNNEFEEVTIDPTASWKPVSVKSIKEEENDPCASRWVKAMSPASMQFPSMSTWDLSHQSSPFPMPPDSQGFNGGNFPDGPGTFGTGTVDFPGPLSHIGDSLSPPDMVSVEKQLNHASSGPYNDGSPQMNPLRHPDQSPSNGHMMPNNPTQPLGNSSHPLSHPQPTTQSNNASVDDLHRGLPELNFDPASIIDGDGHGTGLDLLQDTDPDPLELLSYLGPTDGTADGVGQTGGTGAGTHSSDDLLALFET